jgi:hypothetical protein
MNAWRTMALVAAMSSAALVGCKEKNANNAGNGASTTPTGGGTTKATTGPQATLDQFIEAMQLRDLDMAITLCDESLGKDQLTQLKASLDGVQARADTGDVQSRQALDLVQGTLFGPWDDATGQVTQEEGNFAQATITRGGGAAPLPLQLNKINNQWMVVAPADLLRGGTPPAIPRGTPPTPPTVPMPTTTPPTTPQ